MDIREKLTDVIFDELSAMAPGEKLLCLNDSIHRYYIAERLATRLADNKNRFRSGRRLSDALRERLLDLQKWVMKK